MPPLTAALAATALTPLRRLEPCTHRSRAVCGSFGSCGRSVPAAETARWPERWAAAAHYRAVGPEWTVWPQMATTANLRLESRQEVFSSQSVHSW